MIGPGWMPSRPRPLGVVRRAWSAGALRRRPRRKRVETTPEPIRLAPQLDGFDGGRAELPTAILQRSGAHDDRWIDGYVRHWLATRMAWLRPRIVPLIFAVAGMFGVMRAERYLSSLARGENMPALDANERAQTRSEKEQSRQAMLEAQAAMERVTALEQDIKQGRCGHKEPPILISE